MPVPNGYHAMFDPDGLEIVGRVDSTLDRKKIWDYEVNRAGDTITLRRFGGIEIVVPFVKVSRESGPQEVSVHPLGVTGQADNTYRTGPRK